MRTRLASNSSRGGTISDSVARRSRRLAAASARRSIFPFGVVGSAVNETNAEGPCAREAIRQVRAQLAHDVACSPRGSQNATKYTSPATPRGHDN